MRDDQLNNIRKLMTVPKKLNDQNFCKKKDLKVNLLKIFKNSLLLIRELNESSKDNNQVKQKDYKDFVRSSIVKLFLKISRNLTMQQFLKWSQI